VSSSAQPPAPGFGEGLSTLGYALVPGLWSAEACAEIAAAVRREGTPPLDWNKGRAATSRLFYDLAVHPPILDRVASWLGRDVVLWGADLVVRQPGQRHPWHCDIETAQGEGTLSVWIGLAGTTAETSMSLVERSHRFDFPVQREMAERRRDRNDVDDAEVEAWARARDREATVVTPPLGDGDALFFDGRIWHGSRNRHPSATRVAVLLQYARSDRPIAMPDFSQLAWPFRSLAAPRPPVLVVAGDGHPERHRIVPAPAEAFVSSDSDRSDRGDDRPPRASHRIVSMPVPFSPEPEPWKPHRLFEAQLGSLATLTAHISTLAPGHTPHLPHRHDEEEILIVLDGAADLVVPDLPDADLGDGRLRANRGTLAYFPALFAHTLEAVGDRPVNYLMLRWRGDAGGRPPVGAATPLSARVLDAGLDRDPIEDAALPPRNLLDLPTEWLGLLHVHVSTRAPGTGYAPHVDAHELVLVTLEGTIESDGVAIGPHHALLHAAGHVHGLKAIGDVPARYLVFEFHGRRDGLERWLASPRGAPRGATHFEKGAASSGATLLERGDAPNGFVRPLPVRVAVNALAHALVHRLRGILGRPRS
jgi:mannose-6-phosphate isomerase-like protein (cupin superfamily)